MIRSELQEYRILDHLGNVRTVISQNIGIKPGIDYEPFGKPLFATPERLTFIGKEKDKESDLGDFGVRKYDDDIGRFLSVDPLWEKFRGWSPYHYSYNNPVRFQDGNGKNPIIIGMVRGALKGGGMEFLTQFVSNIAIEFTRNPKNGIGDAVLKAKEKIDYGDVFFEGLKGAFTFGLGNSKADKFQKAITDIVTVMAKSTTDVGEKEAVASGQGKSGGETAVDILTNTLSGPVADYVASNLKLNKDTVGEIYKAVSGLLREFIGSAVKNELGKEGKTND